MSDVPTKDLDDKRFGRLTVISYLGEGKWRCKCDCGNDVAVIGYSLTSGNTRSCGCLNRDMSRLKNTKNESRGKNKRLYRVWASMIQRCTNENSCVYDKYGGRGIFVCDEWRASFQSFLDWAEESGYDPDAAFGDCTIDRIDNDDGYYPENCRWVSMLEQSKNKRIVVHKGVGSPRPVESMDENGNVVDRYPSVKAAGESIGSCHAAEKITAVCRGRKKTYRGFGWRYAEKESHEPNSRESRIPANWKAVEQLDLDGNQIGLFSSIAEAGRALGISGRADHIGDVCSGKRKTAYGYRWRYAECGQ